MTKTLKTLINTSLLMLFVSHSYGLVYNLNDISRPAPQTDYGVTLMDNTTHPGFNGIDDTFDGTVTFNFTLTFDNYQQQNNYVLFQLGNSNGDRIAIGNTFGSNNWGGYQTGSGLLTFGNNPVVEGQSQAFTLTIDYNAGALDTGTLIIVGDSNVYDIGDYDYSFNEIVFLNGLAGTVASGTNMSVEVVPEPATYALIFGALAFGFVAFRRRFKA